MAIKARRLPFLWFSKNQSVRRLQRYVNFQTIIFSPPGSMPRSVDIVLRNEIVDKAKPGDKCVFVGTLIVVPEIYSLMKPGEGK